VVIEVRTQAELDTAPAGSRLIVVGGTYENPLVAWGSSRVEAWGNSHVEARGSSRVEAWDSSHVVARDSSHVVARGSSHVEARGSSRVEAWDSSHVEARGSSRVEAGASATVTVQAEGAEVLLFGFAVAVALAKAKIRKQSRSATVIRPKTSAGVEGWLDREGVAPKRGRVTLFKRVSAAFLTQERSSNETLWLIGSALEHPAWNPVEECGPGQFHACSRPYFCDEFRSGAGDRYVAISILVRDLKVTERVLYPHKIAFRAGRVLYECDRYGKKLEAEP
jgi:hypothetical protein